MSHAANGQEGTRACKNILETGGAGFIGSNFIRYLFGMGALDPSVFGAFSGRVVNLDLLTYAGNAESLADVAQRFPGRYFLEQADICDRSAVEGIFKKYEIDTVVHFAAESHVDRSILGPEAFIKTNVMGTYTLLETARQAWQGRQDVLFHHVSTDEVYGSLGET